MTEVYAALFAWAVTISGYPTAPAPGVVAVPLVELQQMACKGTPCPIYGWFPPGQTVFLNDSVDVEKTTYSASILVHEYTHYLQQQSGKFPQPWTCPVVQAMELEAYSVQTQFLMKHGVYRTVGLTRRGCIDD